MENYVKGGQKPLNAEYIRKFGQQNLTYILYA